MAIYRDTEVFCLSITGRENFQYRPLLAILAVYRAAKDVLAVLHYGAR